MSDRIREIRARLNAATPGPWATRNRPDCRDWVGGRGPDGQWFAVAAPGDSEVMSDRDAEFIAHARQDVPWLVERVEQLEAALHEALNWMRAADQDRAPLPLIQLCQRARSGDDELNPERSEPESDAMT